MGEELKCPHCRGTNIEEDDCIDTEYVNSTTMSRRCTGYCNDCQSSLEWEEVFTFSEYQNIIVCN